MIDAVGLARADRTGSRRLEVLGGGIRYCVGKRRVVDDKLDNLTADDNDGVVQVSLLTALQIKRLVFYSLAALSNDLHCMTQVY